MALATAITSLPAGKTAPPRVALDLTCGCRKTVLLHSREAGEAAMGLSVECGQAHTLCVRCTSAIALSGFTHCKPCLYAAAGREP